MAGLVSATGMFAGWHMDTHRIALEHIRTYKGGAFRQLIDDVTPFVRIFDIVIASDRTSDEEKKAFKTGWCLVDASHT